MTEHMGYTIHFIDSNEYRGKMENRGKGRKNI